MKKGTVVTGIIEYVNFPNKGVLVCEGEKIVVKGTLPGQKVTAVINKGHKGSFEARLLSIDERSEKEVCEAGCKHFGMCGGCSLQTLGYAGQLELKNNQVKKLLDSVIDYEYLFEEPVSSPKLFEYRNKMEFTFGNEYKDGPVVLGLHKKGSFYDIVPVKECQLVSENMREIIAAVSEYATELGYDFFHKNTAVGYLRHLLVRESAKTGEIMVDLITTTQLEGDLDAFVKKLKSLKCSEKIAGILHTKNDSVADAVINEGTELLYGKDYITEELLGISFKITPFSFFQTNSLGAERLYSKVRDYVGTTKDKVIFDLYSGTGTIGQILAPVAKKIVGIEIIEEAVASANETAKANGLNNCEFLAGDVLKKIDEITDKPDFIVLDPPREGINPKAVGKILNYGVDNLVYISCKPTSLVVNLPAFHAAGYKVVKAGTVDMFPFTNNIETVCLLVNQNAKAKQHVNVEIDAEEYYRIKNS